MRSYKAGFVNVTQENYHVNQAGAIANLWASMYHDTSLQMGWVVSNRLPWLTPFQDVLETGSSPTYFFIHNNSSRHGGNTLNHFSSLAPRIPVNLTPQDKGMVNNNGNNDDNLQGSDNDDDVVDINGISIRPVSKASQKKLVAFKFAGLSKCKEALVMATVLDVLDLIELAHAPTPESRAQALHAPDAKYWVTSMNSKHGSLIENEVIIICTLPPGKNAITVKWVFKRKLNKAREFKKWKSCLCAHGF